MHLSGHIITMYEEVIMNTLTIRRKHENHLADYDGLAHLMYLMQALSFLFGGIPFVTAVILNYLNRQHVQGTWIESHYKWQNETFWIGLILILFGLVTLPFFIGFAVLTGTVIWVIHRIVHGWVALSKSKEVKPFTRFRFI
jgi:uncharacterized membrane protein